MKLRKGLILLILTAFLSFSEGMCQEADSVKISKSELREAVKLFMDRDRLLKENELLWKSVLAHEQRFSRALYYDSLRIEKLIITDQRYKKEKKKAKRRLWLSVSFGSMDAFFLLMLLR